MSDETRIGLALLCCMTGGPFGLGFVLAWWVRGRVAAHGWGGAFAPRILRE